MKEQSRSEELSKAIDALNREQPYITRDEELQNLLETAAYVRTYGKSAQETAIISQLSQRIGSDLAARRRRKRWYSAAAGIAAAALLIVNISVQVPADLVPFGREQQPAAPQVAMEGNPAVPIDKQPLTAADPVPDKINKAIPNTAGIAKSNQPMKSEQPKPAATGQAEQAKTAQPAMQEKPVATAQKAETGSAKVIMVLPGRTADTVTEEAGVVKHVYAQNTDKEIVVTQRAKNGSQSGSDVSGSVSVMKAKTDISKLNRAARSVNGVEIIVEGRQSQAELEQVAESLVPTETADSKARTAEAAKEE